MRIGKKITALLSLAAAFIVAAQTVVASADTTLPYDSYNYDYRENIVYTPAPYTPDRSVSGLTIKVGGFNNPQDIYTAEDGRVYIADTNNNRIVVMNREMTKAIEVIDSFVTDDGSSGNFNKPYGVAVSNSNELYIADSQNRRIVHLSAPTTDENVNAPVENNRLYLGKISDPKSEILEDGFDFVPYKVSVDYADRVYVIAANMFQGIMVFEEGNFTGFFGTINVQITTWQKFWRKFSTKEQRSKQQLFIPTEFTGIDVDDDGFIYASNIDTEGIQAVRRLNPKGEDVIRKGENGNVGGDVVYRESFEKGDYNGPSQIIDVVVRDKGIYSLLDKKRGRIFTYDSEGNLLYIFGGLGTQVGTFSVPTAIECIDDNIMVLDSYRGEVIVFKETEYGNLINTAVGLRYDGDETQAVELWRKVLTLDENNELANSGIGKAYLSDGNNEEAMKYLKLGMNRRYYSIAFKRHRATVLKKYLAPALTIVIVLFVAFYAFSIFVRERREAEERRREAAKSHV